MFWLISVSLLAFFSGQQQEKQLTGKVLDTSFSLVRLDKQGRNLLDPSVRNAMSESSIRTAYLIDGKKVPVDNRDRAARYGVALRAMSSATNNYLRVEVYAGKQDQEITTTYIYWPNNEIDTIRTLMTINPALSFISTLWLNGALKYEAGKTSATTWGGFPVERLVIIQR